MCVGSGSTTHAQLSLIHYSVVCDASTQVVSTANASTQCSIITDDHHEHQRYAIQITIIIMDKYHYNYG